MRWALVIQYNGYAYRGWQRQKNCINTIQEQLETALTKVADHEIKVYAAGRTDAGVHAKAQIVHFTTIRDRDSKSWVLGTNSYLPYDISVLAAHMVSDEFHARFAALSRSYEYVIYNSPARAALLHGRVAWEYRSLDAIKMHQAGSYLIGEHDFSAFRGPHCQAASPVKIIKQLEFSRKGDYLYLIINANGFLHHMVRNIVGTLMFIGAGKKDVSWCKRVLASRDRTQAGITAPAAGLYFTGVGYPQEYQKISNYNHNNNLFFC